MKFSIAINLERLAPTIDMAHVIDNVLELVRIADAGGFEIIWAAEHHTLEMTAAPAPFQLLAQWALHTSKARLGTAVVVAPYWHPVRLAGEAALFDLISKGRLEFGIGRGAYQREFDRMAGGLPQQIGGSYMREMLPLLKELWQRDVEHKGEHFSFPPSTSVPKPLQKPYPPLWVAARDPDSYNWAVSQGCSIQSWAMVRPFTEVEKYKRQFEDAVALNPTMPRPRFMTMRQVAIYETETEADGYVEGVMRQGAQFENLFKNLGNVKDGFVEGIDLNAIVNKAEYNKQSIVENLIFGTPDIAIEKLRQYQALGVDNFCYYASYGVSFEAQRRSLLLFIDRVMPAFS